MQKMRKSIEMTKKHEDIYLHVFQGYWRVILAEESIALFETKARLPPASLSDGMTARR